MRDISFGFANMCSLPQPPIRSNSLHRRWMCCNLGSSPWRRSSLITAATTSTMKWASCGKCSSTACISHRNNSNRPITRPWSIILTFAILMILVIASCGLPSSRRWSKRPAVIIATNDKRATITATTCSRHLLQNNNNNPILPIRHGGHYWDIPSHMPSYLPTIKPPLFNKKCNNYNHPSWTLSHLSWAYPALIMSRNIPY